MELSFRKVDVFTALEIVAWEDPPPYELYTLHNSPLALVKMVDGQYYSVFDHGHLIGFFCYGASAQLTNKRDHQLYQDLDYLDVGLGMHPDYCGRGLGVNFVQAGLEFATEQSWQGGFRLTVASDNLRALTVYRRVGFREIGRITWSPNLTGHFLVLTLDSFEPDSITRSCD